MAEKEYIERESIFKQITEIKNTFSPTVRPMFDVFKHILQKTPTADVVEVKHGEWIDEDKCSVCGARPSDIMDADSYYAIGFNVNQLVACPWCGARMR